MRKRSNYRPRPVMTDPLALVTPPSKPEREQMMLRLYTALHAVAAGSQPGEDEWRDLADVVNTLETLALHRKKISAQDVMPIVHRATEAMVMAAKRYPATGAIRLDGQGLQALRDALAIFESCMETLSAREMQLAGLETAQRVRQLRKMADSSDKVVSL